MQDAKTVLQFCDVPLSIDKHTRTVQSLGGNIHNEYIAINTSVKLFKAVEVNKKLCDNGDYIAYKVNDDEEVTVFMWPISCILHPFYSSDLEG